MSSSLDIDIDLLISLVQERPVLWDRTLEVYKDKNQSREAWKSVYCLLKPTYEEMSDTEKKNYGQQVLKKWWNVRDQYVKYKNKQKLAKRSGEGATKFRKYIYHDALQFLEKCLLHAETASSIDPAHEEELIPDESAQLPAQLPATGPTPPATQQSADTPSPSTKRTEPAKITARQGKKRAMDEFEIKMLQAVQTPEPEPDRHVMFFKGIVLSLATFDENQILDFQMGVLKLLKDIKHQGNQAQQAQLSTYTQSTSQITHHDQYRQSQPTFMPQYGTSTHPPPLTSTVSPSPQPGQQYVELTQLQRSQQTETSNATPLYPSPYSDDSNLY